MMISAQNRTDCVPGRTQSVVLVLAFFLLVSAFFPVQAQTKDTMLQFQLSDGLKKGAAAWNRGDLDGFLDGYLHSAELTYVSGGQMVKGFESLRERYEKLYKDNPGAMGQLSFSEIDVWKLAEDRALVVGRWQLDREDAAEKKKDDGVFTLLMVKDGTEWKIFHDHTSESSDR